jgi:hemerythrin-like domain-containing protein
MAVPLDGIRAIHNAFRKDMVTIDKAAETAARGQGNLDLIRKRYTFFNEILVWHADGEEEYVFPALEKVAPLVAEAYEKDHRGLDLFYKLLDKAVNASDTIAITRTTCAYEYHLRNHLYKEDAHLYRIFNERIPLPEQGVIIGKMAQKIPQDRFPEVIGWLYPLIGPDDRENMTRIWQKALLPPAFAAAIKLIQATLGNEWTELARRIPELK